MNVRRSLLTGATALSLIFGAGAAQAETLADALVLAYRHSGLLEKNRAVLRAADEGVAQAISTLRPVIDYVVQAQRTYTFPNDVDPVRVGGSTVSAGLGDDFADTASIAITADLLLYDGGASKLGIDVAKETVLATREALLQVEQQVLYNAVVAYWGVIEAQAFVDLRRSNLDLSNEQLRAARERFDVGEVTRTDVALAEAQLAASRSELGAAEGDLEIARSAYVEAVGKTPGTLARNETPPVSVSSLQNAQEVARKTHPNIKADMRGITISELNVLRAEAGIRPTVSAGASVGVDQDFAESASIGLTMSGPIYRGGRLTSAYREAVAQRDEARADLHITTDTVLQDVAEIWAQRNVARSRIESGQLQVRAAQIAYQGLQEELGLGARTTLDVLDAEQDLQDARAALLTAQIDESRFSYGILFAVGLMTVEHLGLGITTYDASAYYNSVSDAPVRKVSPQGEKLDRLMKSLAR